MRLNADVADTALQESLRQFCKDCQPNLNYGKIYIFISNTFSTLKLTFFLAKKLENALKMVNFRESSLKQLDTLFARWWFSVFFLMTCVYVWKSKRDKNMQYYTPKIFLDVYKLSQKSI